MQIPHLKDRIAGPSHNVKPIPNQDLELGKIPDPEGDSFEYIEAWERFALTLNGYELMGDFRECSALANRVIKDPAYATLTELRCALVFCQRADHHPGGMNVGEENGKNLIKLIRGFPFISYGDWFLLGV